MIDFVPDIIAIKDFVTIRIIVYPIIECISGYILVTALMGDIIDNGDHLRQYALYCLILVAVE